MFSFFRINQYHSYSFIIIKIGYQLIYSPKISNCEITMTNSILALASIARRAQIDIEQKSSHEGVFIMYIR